MHYIQPQFSRIKEHHISVACPAITHNPLKDFYMLKDLNQWIILKNDKIIIRKESSKIVFDFKSHTISELFWPNFFKATKAINYKNASNRFLDENSKYRFNSLAYQYAVRYKHKKFTFLKFDLNYLNFKKFEMSFLIDHPKEKQKRFNIIIYDDISSKQRESLYLFYVYLAAYISGKEASKLINFNKLNHVGNSMRIYFSVELEDFN